MAAARAKVVAVVIFILGRSRELDQIDEESRMERIV